MDISRSLLFPCLSPSSFISAGTGPALHSTPPLDSCVHSQSCLTVCPGASCHFLLQGIFPTRGSNSRRLHLLHWPSGSFPAEPLRKPLHPTLVHSVMSDCNLRDCGSSPGSSVHRIFSGKNTGSESESVSCSVISDSL